MLARSAALTLLVLAAGGCTDRDAPRPVNDFATPPPATDTLRPLSSRETAAAPAAVPPSTPPAATTANDPDDPAEPGIDDLPRLARYVFRTMQRHEEVCPFGNPFRDRLHFALEVEVKGGRMLRVGMGHVGLEPTAGGAARTLTQAQWPGELVAYVACLTPHLKTVVMSPAPADGTYEPVYSFGENAAGRAGP
jgi:hypothetical protein